MSAVYLTWALKDKGEGATGVLACGSHSPRGLTAGRVFCGVLQATQASLGQGVGQVRPLRSQGLHYACQMTVSGKVLRYVSFGVLPWEMGMPRTSALAACRADGMRRMVAECREGS